MHFNLLFEVIHKPLWAVIHPRAELHVALSSGGVQAGRGEARWVSRDLARMQAGQARGPRQVRPDRADATEAGGRPGANPSADRKPGDTSPGRPATLCSALPCFARCWRPALVKQGSARCEWTRRRNATAPRARRDSRISGFGPWRPRTPRSDLAPLLGTRGAGTESRCERWPHRLTHNAQSAHPARPGQDATGWVSN